MDMYPQTLSEEETLRRALSGESIARVGEGELKTALGRGNVSQVAVPALAVEMRRVLDGGGPFLPCLPRIWDDMPNFKFWMKFQKGPFSTLCKAITYGSAFITRPDVAQNIDTPAYWSDIEGLWKDRDVTLVLGSTKSLTPGGLSSARSVRAIWGPRQDAYAVIDQLQEEIGRPSGPVILCLGATATVLAARLARRGLWALDLGHLGMFMSHQGTFTLTALISDEYRAQQVLMHERGYGGGGGKHASVVREFARGLDTILDYGCGQGKLKLALPDLTIFEYDPGIPGKDKSVKPAELIVCTDVLEHIEPDRLGIVLAHIYNLGKRRGYFEIATRPANKILPDGRNAHLIIQSEEWWLTAIRASGWNISSSASEVGHHVSIWATKR